MCVCVCVCVCVRVCVCMCVCSGLKQCGILSPLFYNIYVDDLTKQLSCEKLGCTIGGIYSGTIFYADEIVL